MHATTKRARRSGTDVIRNNSRNTRNSNAVEELECHACKSIISDSGDYVQNTPCNHIICTLCVVKSNMRRGSNPACCQVESCSNRCTTLCQYFSGGSPVEVIKNERVASDNYAKRFLPMDFLLSNHSEEVLKDKNKEAFVFFGGQFDDQRNVRSISTSFVLEKDSGGNYILDQNENASSSIVRFFRWLHPIIVNSSKRKHIDDPVLTPREYMELRLSSPPPILNALYSLSTGCNLKDFRDVILNANEDTTNQNHFLGAAAASDILMRSNSTKPNCFQLMLGECLGRQTTSREFKKLCSAFQIAPSVKFSVRQRSKEVIKRLDDGLKFGEYDLVVLLADNCGFRVIGKKASYDQWTILVPVIITEKELRAVGFYCDDPSKRLSREPACNWEDAIASAKGDEDKINKLIDSIVGITDEDYISLGESVLEDIRIALEYAGLLRHNNANIIGKALPRLERICNESTCEEWKQALRDADRQRRHQNNPFQPTCTRASEPVVIPRDNTSGDMGLQPDPKSNPDTKSKYKLNNASLEPVHQDLAKNTTQTELMKYIAKCCENQVKEFDKANHPPNTERPVAEIVAALGVDGAPAATCQKQLAQNALDGYKEYPKHMLVSSGGFHTVMKTLNAVGELFEETLTHFVKAWRDSLDSQKWFLFPTDPRQREKEQPWYLIAHYVDAAVKLSDHQGGTDISANDVNAFMLERAKKYPLCMLVLLETRLTTIAKMMKNAERIGERGSVELFFTAVRFAMRLFAMTHKVDYMRLTCNLLLWWHCASDAQKKIYSSFIFTQVTAKGTSIFHDLFVELAVKDIRSALGKVHTKGLELVMEHSCASIPEQDAEKLEATELRNKDASSGSSASAPYSRVTEDFIKVYTKISGMDLWTPDKAPIIGKLANAPIYAKTDSLEVPGRQGGSLHAAILDCITSLGDRRVREYFEGNYIQVNNRVDRTEKEEDGGVSLAKMSTTVKKLEDDMRKRIVRATATTKKTIKENMKIDDIKEEYEKLRLTESNGVKLCKLKSSLKHDAYANALAEARKKVFKKHVDMKNEIIETIEQEYKENELSKEVDRVSILEDHLFTFPQDVHNKERYKEKFNLLPHPI